MTEPICFNCGIRLGLWTSMEKLLKKKLPVFCCPKCSEEFPDKDTKEFEEKLKELHQNTHNIGNGGEE